MHSITWVQLNVMDQEDEDYQTRAGKYVAYYACNKAHVSLELL